MGCLEVILKGILIVTNVVVLVAGILLLVVAGIFFTKTFDFYPDLEDYSTNVNAVLIPMLVLGGVLLLVGLVGCLGACTGKTGLLNCYFFVVMVVVILEIAIIGLAVWKKDEVKNAVLDTAKGLCEEYAANATTDMRVADKLAVNVVQNVAMCCGYKTGPSYWNNATKIVVSNSLVPPGCCAGWDGEDISQVWVECNTTYPDNTEQYQNGCVEEITSIMDNFGIVIIAIVAAVIVFELVCLCAACYSKNNDMVA